MGVADKTSTVGLALRIGAGVLRERVGPSIALTGPDTVPPSAEAMTASWLTSVLCQEVKGASVVGFEILGGSDGTSSRRQVLVTYNDAGSAAGLPTRLFTKSTPSFFSRMLLGLTDIAEGEATFYNRVRPGLELRSPQSFYAGYDPKTTEASRSSRT